MVPPPTEGIPSLSSSPLDGHSLWTICLLFFFSFFSSLFPLIFFSFLPLLLPLIYDSPHNKRHLLLFFLSPFFSLFLPLFSLFFFFLLFCLVTLNFRRISRKSKKTTLYGKIFRSRFNERINC